jgi:hypothetical protein
MCLVALHSTKRNSLMFSPFVGLECEAHNSINNDPVPTNTSLHNSQARYHKFIPFKVTLQPGDVNTITFGISESSSMLCLGPLTVCANCVISKELEDWMC